MTAHPERKPEALVWPVPACCLGNGDGCVCPAEERALRGWAGGRLAMPMTPDQRAWCLDEIGRVEGYDRAQHETDTDSDLAGTVLCAWVDYCRDIGCLS